MALLDPDEGASGRPGEGPKGKLFFVGEPYHDINEREGKTTQVFPGQRSKIDYELVLQLPEVKVKWLVVLRGTGLRSTLLQFFEGLGNCVEADGG